MNGSIRVISGCMFSGKTSRLIWHLKRAQLAGRKVMLFKPSIDNRYSVNEVVTHDNDRLPSIVIDNPLAILEQARDIDVVGIDEIHFMDHQSLLSVANQLADMGKTVIAAGLDLDAEDRAFEATKELAAAAEIVEKLSAVRADCNQDIASRSYRKSQSKERFEVGGKDAYDPLCRDCNNKRKGKV